MNACYYTVKGYQPLLIDNKVYEQGRIYRPLPKDDYPIPNTKFCKKLFSPTNLNAPFKAPNLYPNLPAWPKMLQSSLLGKAHCTTELQTVKEEGTIAFEQAVSLQASDRLKENIDAEDNS